MNFDLFLPFPPSVNNYYVKTNRGVYISHKGRKFRDQVGSMVTEQMPNVKIDYKIMVEVILYPPDNRIRDLGNYDKALMDAITHSGLWEDDSLIDQAFWYRGEVRRVRGQSEHGLTRIRISEAGPILPWGVDFPE